MYRRPSVTKKKCFFLTGGGGCTQVKSREMGLGLMLKNESVALRHQTNSKLKEIISYLDDLISLKKSSTEF